MDYWLWIAIVGLGLIAILFFNRQLKFVFDLVRNAVIGSVGILLCNMLLAPTGFAVGINVLTLFIVSVLGVPGFLLLYLSQWIVS